MNNLTGCSFPEYGYFEKDLSSLYTGNVENHVWENITMGSKNIFEKVLLEILLVMADIIAQFNPYAIVFKRHLVYLSDIRTPRMDLLFFYLWQMLGCEICEAKNIKIFRSKFYFNQTKLNINWSNQILINKWRNMKSWKKLKIGDRYLSGNRNKTGMATSILKQISWRKNWSDGLLSSTELDSIMGMKIKCLVTDR